MNEEELLRCMAAASAAYEEAKCLPKGVLPKGERPRRIEEARKASEEATSAFFAFRSQQGTPVGSGLGKASSQGRFSPAALGAQEEALESKAAEVGERYSP